MNSALSLPLPFAAPSPAPDVVRPSSSGTFPAQVKPRRGRSKIWLALHFPDWPLIAALPSVPIEKKAALAKLPIIVTDADRQRRVVACNEAALHVGIRPGHSMNAAIALHPQLHVLERDEQKERSLLVKLAERCQCYSSVVSVEEPDELLIEIRGSLRLFGGLSALMQRIRSDLISQNISTRLSAAPTPESAMWFARASNREVIQPRELRAAMERLPIASLRWPADIELRVWRFGIRTVGELLRLPRGELARRIGADRLRELDRAFGRQPSIRKSVIMIETFRDVVRLDFDVTSTALIEPLLQQSLWRLAKFLKQRQLCVGEIAISLRHRDDTGTALKIALARPSADADHLQSLLQQKLYSLSLPAPVTDIVVRADRLLRAQSSDRSLFCSDDRRSQQLEERQARLYEQMVGRLGEQRLFRLAAAADYRPERAQRYRPALQPAAGNSPAVPPDLPRRPLWLLKSPRRIHGHQLRRVEQPQAGPESLDFGWWDGLAAHRDYFVAHSITGALLWIFRDRVQPASWYVHGLFA